MTDKQETILYFILQGVLMNGFLQGKHQDKINTSVVKVAIEEIKKIVA